MQCVCHGLFANLNHYHDHDKIRTTYYFLANIDDEEDFCVRKIEKENDDQLLVGLDSDQEFDRAMLMFMKKNKGYFG